LGVNLAANVRRHDGHDQFSVAQGRAQLSHRFNVFRQAEAGQVDAVFAAVAQGCKDFAAVRPELDRVARGRGGERARGASTAGSDDGDIVHVRGVHRRTAGAAALPLSPWSAAPK
jgi:hypothetical protein